MSVVAAPLPHQPFSDTELYAQGSSVSAQPELPPVPPHLVLPIPVPSQGIPFSKFQHRHSSPYPMPHQQSFSALGPLPSLEGAAVGASVVTAAPSPTPKASAASSPALAPDLNPQSPLPLTPEPSPPGSKLLEPTMMIKLAPPAEEGIYDESLDNDSTTPRRVPTFSVDSATMNVDSVRMSLPRPRSNSGTLVMPAIIKTSATDPKPARPKSMGPPPRVKRSQTSYPHQSVRMVESKSAESRAKLRANKVLRASSYSPVVSGSTGLVRAASDAGTMPRTFTADEMGPPDLGGPDGLEAKVVLLGSQGVGKTSLILRYTTRAFSPTPSPATIGSSLHTRKLVHSGVRVKLQIWDTAGQERFRSMAPIYYRGAHVCVLVYDISDQNSFLDVRSWLEELSKTVPKETMIFVVGAKTDLESKRQVDLGVARETIRSWVKPPPPALAPKSTLHQHQRSLYRTSTSVSRLNTPINVPSNTPIPSSTRNQSYIFPASTSASRSSTMAPVPKTTDSSNLVLESEPICVPKPNNRPSTAPEFNKDNENVNNERRRRRHSSKPFPVKINVPLHGNPSLSTSPSRLEFPSLQSPAQPTSATFTEPVRPSMAFPSGHRSQATRFSISGISEVLGFNRTMSMNGAISSLSQLAESPSSPALSQSPETAGNPSTFQAARLPHPPRTRVESTPLLHSNDTDRNIRRRSEEWSRSGWKMGEGPGAAEALNEFGAGVRRRESEELLRNGNKTFPSLGHASPRTQGRGRGGSLGRDPRLLCESEGDGSWGIDVEGVRLGECSARDGEGVEELFNAITTILAERKDKLAREQALRHKSSVILVDPASTISGNDKTKKSFGCCV
ncbi:hypothetical protein L204_104233 [Cryptococcus depauperatus]